MGMYVKFNGRELNVANTYEILDIDYSQIAPITVSSGKLARADGEKITSSFYGNKQVKIIGRVLATNNKDMQTKKDSLPLYLYGLNKTLEFPVADVTRAYTATLTQLTFEDMDAHSQFTAIYSCRPFGSDVTTQSLTLGTADSNSEAWANTIGGTAPAEPIITMEIQSIVPYYQSSSIEIANAALNQTFQLTRTFNWFDKIVINSALKTCQIYQAALTLIDEMDSTTGWTSDRTLEVDSSYRLHGSSALYLSTVSSQSTGYLQRLDATAFDASTDAGTLLFGFYNHAAAPNVTSLVLTLGSDATLAANFITYTVTTDYLGNAFHDGWNIVAIPLDTAPTSTNGTPNRDAIISMKIAYTFGSSGQLYNFTDYMIIVKPQNATATACDYSGLFLELEPGAQTITYADEEVTTRDIDFTGTYTKRYLL